MKNPASGRILSVALDHAPSYGLLNGLENIRLGSTTFMEATR